MNTAFGSCLSIILVKFPIVPAVLLRMSRVKRSLVSTSDDLAVGIMILRLEAKDHCQQVIWSQRLSGRLVFVLQALVWTILVLDHRGYPPPPLTYISLLGETTSCFLWILNRYQRCVLVCPPCVPDAPYWIRSTLYQTCQTLLLF